MMVDNDPRSRVGEPQRRLMAAVLQTVLDDFRGSAYRRARGYGTAVCALDASKAIAYVASTDRTWPFSFENVCEALGLSSIALRKELAGGLPMAARSPFVPSLERAAER